VKWVAELSGARRKYVQENFSGVQTTEDWKTVFQDKEVRGVVIATTAATHFDLTKQALEAGKHALVEKPLAMTFQQAKELQSIARSKNLTLMVGHTFLYNTAVQYLQKLIQNGDLGSVYYIYAQRLNLGQVRSDVNVWWNLAPHDVSILLALMNHESPQSISAQGMSYIQEGIDDVAFATLRWANGIAAHIHVSWLDPGKTRKVTVVGNKKMVVYDDMLEDKIAIFNKGVDRIPVIGERMDYDQVQSFKLQQRAGDILLPKIEAKEPLKSETGHFVECILSGAEPITGSDHACQVVQILEAGAQALKTGKEIQLPQFRVAA
jgi:predicted dehydrogenase